MARKLQLIGNFLSGEIDSAKIKAAVDEYLKENPPGTGSDGFSPIVAIEEIEGGHKITITDVNGSKSFNVYDGRDGQPGTDTPQNVGVPFFNLAEMGLPTFSMFGDYVSFEADLLDYMEALRNGPVKIGFNMFGYYVDEPVYAESIIKAANIVSEDILFIAEPLVVDGQTFMAFARVRPNRMTLEIKPSVDTDNTVEF